MRKVVGGVVLLLGVLLVAAAAWWGATTLFEGDGSEDEPSGDVECVPVAARGEADAARRAFTKEHADARWFRSAGVKKVDDGFVVLVTLRGRTPTPELPGCSSGVPLVVRGGPPQTG